MAAPSWSTGARAGALRPVELSEPSAAQLWQQPLSCLCVHLACADVGLSRMLQLAVAGQLRAVLQAFCRLSVSPAWLRQHQHVAAASGVIGWLLQGGALEGRGVQWSWLFCSISTHRLHPASAVLLYADTPAGGVHPCSAALTWAGESGPGRLGVWRCQGCCWRWGASFQEGCRGRQWLCTLVYNG